MSCMSTGKISRVVLGVSAVSSMPLARPRRLTLDQGFPDMDRGLSDRADIVLAHNVQRGKDPVPALWPQGLEQRFASVVGAVSWNFLFFQLDLATDPSDTI